MDNTKKSFFSVGYDWISNQFSPGSHHEKPKQTPVKPIESKPVENMTVEARPTPEANIDLRKEIIEPLPEKLEKREKSEKKEKKSKQDHKSRSSKQITHSEKHKKSSHRTRKHKKIVKEKTGELVEPAEVAKAQINLEFENQAFITSLSGDETMAVSLKFKPEPQLEPAAKEYQEQAKSLVQPEMHEQQSPSEASLELKFANLIQQGSETEEQSMQPEFASKPKVDLKVETDNGAVFQPHAESELEFESGSLPEAKIEPEREDFATILRHKAFQTHKRNSQRLSGQWPMYDEEAFIEGAQGVDCVKIANGTGQYWRNPNQPGQVAGQIDHSLMDTSTFQRLGYQASQGDIHAHEQIEAAKKRNRF